MTHRAYSFTTSVLLIATVAAVSACSHAAPVSPRIVDSPRTAVVMDPYLAESLAIPNDRQAYGSTDDGLLTYTFQLQNSTPDPIWIRVKAVFFDQTRNVVDDQLPAPRTQIRGSSIESIRVVSSSPKAHFVQVQVLREGVR